jgi:hypothetical protein
MESEPQGTPGPAAPAPDSQRRSALPLLLVGVLAVAAAILLALRDESRDGAPTSPHGEAAVVAWTPTERPNGETVALEIDFGNGARRQFEALPFSEGMTVGDLLRQAGKFRPAIEFEHHGAGEEALLTSLEGVKNEGAGGRFWTYQVNGQFANVSFDVQPLAAGDRVLWKFAPAE